MTLDEWKRLALTLKQTYSPAPHIILWGGEPLVCPFFDELVEYLKALDFTLGLVTNGVLLDKHMDLCRRAFRTIYLSIDGPAHIHNAIRGEGVFEKVSKNLALLSGGNAKVEVMSVLSPALLDELDGFPELMAEYGANSLLLQDYIQLSAQEAYQYKKWMKERFDTDAREIDAWVGQLPEHYPARKKAALQSLLEKTHPIPVTYIPHHADGQCLSPCKHIHISWNGDVMYCTDFYDFCAGNVRNEDIADIFENEKTRRFRDELHHNPTCAHCAWKNNKSFYLQ
ncbi:MAG: radical SAM protein [Ruminococcaceae bacterium]|nr:radical SAM protein [Oscillospiraceae bacterium]